MATILEQIKNLEKLDEKTVLNSIFAAVKKAEKLFLDANKSQLLKGENSEGKIVGEYSQYTEGFADRDGILTPKTPNSPYNFNWTGEFLKGFLLNVDGDGVTISSSGIGTGGKRDFLTNENLFGLTDENLSKIIKDEIIPFVNAFARKTLKI